MYITSFHGIEERIKAGGGEQLLVAKAGPRAKELVDLALGHKIRVQRTGTYELDRLAPGNKGVALLSGAAGELAPLNIEAAIAGLGDKKNALVVIMDEITDPHNYGAIIRSCDQFGVDFVLTRDRRIAKRGQTVAQTSSGADAWVRILEAPLQRSLQSLKHAGFWIYGADMSGEPAFQRDLRGRVALVFGGEGEGISRLLRDECDTLVGIPSFGKLESLNVSVAAGILLYEVRRQWKI